MAEIIAATEAVTETETETETGTEIETVTEIAREDAAAIPVQCPALGIIMIVTIMITETLQERIFRESEEEKPVAVIIIPSRTKYLDMTESPVQLILSRTFLVIFIFWCVLLSHDFFP